MALLGREFFRFSYDARSFAVLAGIAAIYFVAGKLGLLLAFVNVSASAVWPPTGIAIAAFLLFGLRIWPSIFAGAFFVNASTAGSLLTSLAIALGNTLEGAAAALLVTAFAEGRNVFARASNIFKFVVIAALTAPVSASIGVTSLALGGFADWEAYRPVWFTWWLGDVTGALLITPLILLWSKEFRIRLGYKRKAEALAFFAVIIITSVLIFIWLSRAYNENYPIGFVAIPLLMWAAFRFGQRGTISASFIIAVIALWGTLNGYGPFARGDPNESLILLQAFMAIVTVTALAVSAVVKEHHHNEESAKALLESIGDGIVATDRENKIIAANKAFENLIGWGESTVVGKKITDILPMNSLEHSEKRLLSTPERPSSLATQRSEKITAIHALVRRDGSKFPAAITAAPIEIGGSIVGAIKVIRDVSKEQEVDKAKSEFIALASHQLRTPLTIMGWYIETLLKKRGTVDAEEEKIYLEQAFRANRRMAALTDTLLNISRVEAGTFTADPSAINIADLAQATLDEFAHDIAERNLTVEKYFEPNAPSLYTDPNLIRIIFTNILSNAIKYTPHSGKMRVEISYDAGQGAICIQIADTGYGIPARQQGEVFTKLFRADNIKEIDTNGTGLGLYLVKSIVEYCGGTIWFTSQEGQGSTFFVTLPIAGMKSKGGAEAQRIP